MACCISGAVFALDARTALSFSLLFLSQFKSHFWSTRGIILRCIVKIDKHRVV